VNILSDVKQITCILPKGKSAAVQKSLIDDHGIYSANFHYARGIGKFSSGRGFGEQREKEILEVMVSPDIADEIFEYVFFKADMDQAHGGIMFMTPLPKMSVMEIPETSSK